MKHCNTWDLAYQWKWVLPLPHGSFPSAFFHLHMISIWNPPSNSSSLSLNKPKKESTNCPTFFTQQRLTPITLRQFSYMILSTAAPSYCRSRRCHNEGPRDPHVTIRIFPTFSFSSFLKKKKIKIMKWIVKVAVAYNFYYIFFVKNIILKCLS